MLNLNEKTILNFDKIAAPYITITTYIIYDKICKTRRFTRDLVLGRGIAAS